MEQALGEVEFCGDIYGYYADRAEEFLADEPIELLAGEGTALIRRTSMGPLIGIMPWNFPYYQVARFAGPNLIVGNPILLKPAPQCPESAAAIQAMYDEAGFPEGAYQTILATNEQIAERDRRPAGPRRLADRLRAGRRRGRRDRRAQPEEGRPRARRLRPVHPARRATTSTRPSRRRSTRASTTPASRATRRSGSSSPTSSTTTSSTKFTDEDEGGRARRPDRRGRRSARSPRRPPPSASQDQLDRAVAQGAEVVAGGGERKDNFFPTTVLTGITPDNDAYREEFFGPVASVYRVGSEEEAIELANDTPFGLGSYVFTDDSEQAERVADGLETGMVFVNGVGLDGAELPVRRRQALRLRPRARPLRAWRSSSTRS